MRRGFGILRLLRALFGLLLLVCLNSASHSTESNIVSLTGEWTVASQTVSPLIITRTCKPILKGTNFTFTENALEVYTDSSKKPCNIYRFKITDNAISFIQNDMIWLCTYQLNLNRLKIRSNNFFIPDTQNSPVTLNNQSVARQEVEITLIKK